VFSITTLALVAVNLALLYGFLAVPLGRRTIRLRRVIPVPPGRVWNALYPLGKDAGWSGEVVAAAPLPGEPGRIRMTIGWAGRDDKPIARVSRIYDLVEGERFSLIVEDDTSLDRSFWSSFAETVVLEPAGEGTLVEMAQTDRYRGAAFLVFRYFAMRRELDKLSRWLRTGQYRRGGIFEHPLTQIGFAVLSALILWPIFGLTIGGLVLASVLTLVVALHELGHMAAFRLMGHRSARMIFIPLLGGIAIGGRPYDSRFEVAFVALMGAGFSAFLVPIAIAGSAAASEAGMIAPAAVLATLAGIAALFNIANLVPVWKFDGGQVLRQICPGPIMLAAASFLLLLGLLGVGSLAGAPPYALLFAGAVFAAMSLMTAGNGVKPRHDLKPIGGFDRFAIAAAMLAVMTIHGCGVLWASARLAAYNAGAASVADGDAFAPGVRPADKS